MIINMTQVTTAHGKPLSSCEVALVVVDESVLALTGYKMKHPLLSFYDKVQVFVRLSFLHL